MLAAFGSDDDDMEANGEEEEVDAEFEAVPETMTAAVVQEETNVRRAVIASRESAAEDETVRRVMEETMEED